MTKLELCTLVKISLISERSEPNIYASQREMYFQQWNGRWGQWASIGRRRIKYSDPTRVANRERNDDIKCKRKNARLSLSLVCKQNE